MSLSLTLHHVIVDINGLKKTTAADTIAKVIGTKMLAVFLTVNRVIIRGK